MCPLPAAHCFTFLQLRHFCKAPTMSCLLYLHSSCRMRQIDDIAPQPLQHLCSWTTLQAKQAPSIQLTDATKLSSKRSMEPPPEVPRTFQAILVAFWGSGWLPKLPSGFPGIVAGRMYNGGSKPIEAYRTHLAGYPPKLPPVMEEYCSLLQCCMLGTGGTCEGGGALGPWG